MRKISYSRGRGKLRHNNRDMISANVDINRVTNNITLIKKDLALAYDEIFGEAVSAYNKKQRRPERRIDDYFVKLFGEKPTDTVLKNDLKQQSFYEYVVGVGTKDDTGYESNPEMAREAVICLQEYMKGFQQRNPKFYVFNAVIHQDEATPHLHFDFIPYADGYKNGMSRKQGIAKALEQMGYGVGENAYKCFTQSERNVFRQICENHGIDVAPEEKGRGYTFTTAEYRKNAELVKENAELKVKNEQVKCELSTNTEKLDVVTGELCVAEENLNKCDNYITKKIEQCEALDEEVQYKTELLDSIEADIFHRVGLIEAQENENRFDEIVRRWRDDAEYEDAGFYEKEYDYTADKSEI